MSDIKGLLPHNISAEESVLGAIMFAPNLLEDLPETLPPEAFMIAFNREVYKTAIALYKEKKFDLLAVASQSSNPASTAAKLVDFTQSVIGTGDVKQHVEMIMDCYQRRRLIEFANNVITKAQDKMASVDELRGEMDQTLTQIYRNEESSTVRSLEDILRDLLPKLGEPHDGVSLGLESVDNLLAGGLRPKTFTVIAARPSMGKTWVGNMVARAIAGTQKPAIIFSAEMGMDQLATRFLATETGVDLGSILSRNFSDSEWERLHSAVPRIRQPIWIDDTVGSALSLNHIKSVCHKIKRKYGEVGVVVVDYLQLLGDRGSANRAGEVGKYSGGMNDLAKILDCPVVALAQLNRGVENRQDKRPMLADLKESGDIEQDAHCVVFLYREDYYDKEQQNDGREFVKLYLIFAKNRNGSCGTAKVFFQPATGQIVGDLPTGFQSF